MRNVLRIEIVVDAPHSSRVIDLLADQEISAFTLIRGASGSGERGSRMGDDITGVSSNHYILTTCPPEKLDALACALRPFLQRVGGMCLVSEARWLLH